MCEDKYIKDWEAFRSRANGSHISAKETKTNEGHINRWLESRSPEATGKKGAETSAGEPWERTPFEVANGARECQGNTELKLSSLTRGKCADNPAIRRQPTEKEVGLSK